MERRLGKEQSQIKMADFNDSSPVEETQQEKEAESVNDPQAINFEVLCR